MKFQQPSQPGHGASRKGMRRNSANIRARDVTDTEETSWNNSHEDSQFSSSFSNFNLASLFRNASTKDHACISPMHLQPLKTKHAWCAVSHLLDARRWCAPAIGTGCSLNHLKNSNSNRTHINHSLNSFSSTCGALSSFAHATIGRPGFTGIQFAKYASASL